MDIRLFKVSDDVFEGRHPNMINEGHIERGIMISKPKVNRVFYIQKGNGYYFQTSRITEIIEDNEISGKFKTLNSTYEWHKDVRKFNF